ncbi:MULTISPECIES: dTDP-glucose 4,6-dehydratase [Cyanophyceae]|uniref:dTDP-glucose 4,6-dehydratase n=1 Tax=Cyanophyceae TaxID=3028117 RepID=UPI001686C5BC|nr:dTDP-glucose 4,6-dehydratase [Trichocoleus sp. FACHB-40]MBD2003818.1 dTDP-glucose 4,6-dehydratase [Trichocoleus sp. FACHB-40]
MPVKNHRSLLVTGGAGFIGSNFVHYWCNAYPSDRVVVLDALTYAGNLGNLALEGGKNFRFVQGDICDRALVDTLLQEENIDTIAHFAAESHVDRSILGPGAFVQTNVVGTFTLLEAFRHHRLTSPRQPPQRGEPPQGAGSPTSLQQGEELIPRSLQENSKSFDLAYPNGQRGIFLHISTDEVYGSLAPEDPPFTETTPYAPNSPYSASKAGSDHLVRAYYHTYKLPTIITNCSNNYGAYQFPEKLIPLMCINILMGKELPIYGDGQNLRDWLFVDDHCQALDIIIHRGEIGETYNIGGNNEVKNIDLVKMLCQLMDELAADLPVRPSSNLITFVKDRLGHDRRYAIDSTKLKIQLGWTPSVTLEAGLRRTVQWYLTRRDWWEPLLSEEYQEYYHQVYVL